MAMNSGLDVRDQLMRLGRSWGWYAFLGVASLLAGIIALAWPGRTLVVLAVIFGVQLVVSGVFRLVGAITMDEASGSARALSAILGVLALVLGLYALRHIVITLLALGILLAIFWIVEGIGEVIFAIDHRNQPGRVWLGVSGVFGVIAGLILLSWPGLSLLTLAVIAGIWLIMFGVLQLMIARHVRALGTA